MNDGGILAVVKEDIMQHANNSDVTQLMDRRNFVELFPPELSNKLFSYVSEKDIFNCAKCCISWQQVINDNAQWKLRCRRRGWATATSGSNVYNKWKWTNSHVSENESYKFRTSPVFILPEIASLRVSPLCDWAIYFRQCYHIERNWYKGIYVIHRLADLNPTDYFEYATILNNDFDCNGKLLVCGTSLGSVIVWSVDGVSTYLTSTSIRRRVEVESVILKSNFLIALYQTGLIKVFDTRKLLNTKGDPGEGRPELELAYAIRGIGSLSEDGFEFVLNVQLIDENDAGAYASETGVEDIGLEVWIRDLFRVDLWMGSDTVGSDMMIYANDSIVVLTGQLCRSFFYWNIEQGDQIRQVLLPNGFKVIYQSFLSARKLYLSTKRRDDGNENPSSFVLVFDLSSPETYTDAATVDHIMIIPSETMVEEIRPDSLDQRIAFSTQDGSVCGVGFANNEFLPLFTKHSPSFVDNLAVSDSLIVYHQYDGFLVGINWHGDTLYEIEAHTGLVKRLQILDDRLISAGDAMQLCVWNSKPGEMLHKVHHQPCRIQHLYADSTKIITLGREEPPVVVAYW